MRGFLVHAPDAQTVFLEQIHDAQRERIVRPDDGEFDFLFPRECEQLRQILRADVDAFDRVAQPFAPGEPAHFLRDAGVARRAPHLRDMRRLREFPHERVFASARTDDAEFSFSTTNFQTFQDGQFGGFGIKAPKAVTLQRQGRRHVQQIVGAKAVARRMPQRQLLELPLQFGNRHDGIAKKISAKTSERKLACASAACSGETKRCPGAREVNT